MRTSPSKKDAFRGQHTGGVRNGCAGCGVTGRNRKASMARGSRDAGRAAREGNRIRRVERRKPNPAGHFVLASFMDPRHGLVRRRGFVHRGGCWCRALISGGTSAHEPPPACACVRAPESNPGPGSGSHERAGWGLCAIWHRILVRARARTSARAGVMCHLARCAEHLRNPSTVQNPGIVAQPACIVG